MALITMSKTAFKFLLISTFLSACQESNSLPDLSKQRAVYNTLYKNTFVISHILDDHGSNLLDSVFYCAMDDTFSIKKYDMEGEIPTGKDIILRVNLGQDWCDEGEKEIVVGWGATLEHDQEISFRFLLPPDYSIMNFSTNAENPNHYYTDQEGDFSLSVRDKSNSSLLYKFQMIKASFNN